MGLSDFVKTQFPHLLMGMCQKFFRVGYEGEARHKEWENQADPRLGNKDLETLNNDFLKQGHNPGTLTHRARGEQ